MPVGRSATCTSNVPGHTTALHTAAPRTKQDHATVADAANDDGDDILYVAAEAAHHFGIGDNAFAKQTPYDDLYETATNPDGWASTGS